jgi:hypothetical protein
MTMTTRDPEDMRRCRARKKAKRALVEIEIDLPAVREGLVDRGFLAAWDEEDRKELRSALQKALAQWFGYEEADELHVTD